jgi:leader peptidase (prepilin peptidase)/N-methyltransferase
MNVLTGALSYVVSLICFAWIAHWRGARVLDSWASVFGVAGAGLLTSVSRTTDPMEGIAIAVAVAALAVCAWTDMQLGLAFDQITLGGLTVVLCVRAIEGSGCSPTLLGSAGAGGTLMALHLVTRGRGMGLGDVKLAALIGALLGAVDAAIALGIAFVAGAAVGVSMILARRADRASEFRFAPYLAAGAGVAYALFGGA